jgi:hypothetical protein
MDKPVNVINISTGWLCRPVAGLTRLPGDNKGFKPVRIGPVIQEKASALLLKRAFSVPDFSRSAVTLEFSTPCKKVAIWIDGKAEKIATRQGEKVGVRMLNISPGKKHTVVIGLAGKNLSLSGPVILAQSVERLETHEYTEPLEHGSDRFYALNLDGDAYCFATRKYLDVNGVPFQVADWQDRLPGPVLVHPYGEIPIDLPGEKKTKAFRVGGVVADHIYFAGMVSSYDCGTGWMYHKSNDVSQEQFVGDRLGEIVIRYADRSTESIPLIFGYTIFWYAAFNTADVEPAAQFDGGIAQASPFVDDPKAMRDLDRCLFLNEGYPESQFAYILKYQPQRKAIKTIAIKPNPKLLGDPLIGAITLETARPGNILAPLPAVPKTNVRWKTLTRKDLDQKSIAGKIRRLQSHLYTFEKDIPSRFETDIPPGFKGPRLDFEGNRYADMLTNIYYHSARVMAQMVADDGSTTGCSEALPWWGLFRHAMGCYKKPRLKRFPSRYAGVGGEVWSRDFGRAIFELAGLGFDVKSRAAVSLCDRSIDLCHPPHWTRVWIPSHLEQERRTLDGSRYRGMPENNGHGLVTLARYRTWNASGRDRRWLTRHWEATKKAADWIFWQLEHPTIRNQPRGTIFTTGEVGTGWHDVYSNAACLNALKASVQMASSLNKAGEVKRWTAAVKLMQNAQDKHLVDRNNAKSTWRFIHTDDLYQRRTDWRQYGQSLGPIIMAADTMGYDLRDWGENSLAISRHTLLDRLAEAIPPYYFCSIIGYGQGFITQAALLLDEMGHSEQLIRALAKYVYFPDHLPWIVPEGTIVHPSGKYWYRVGALGNQVQVGEVIKILRIMLGVDDFDPHHLKVMPRIPATWKGFTLYDFPATTSSKGKLSSVPLNVTYGLSRRQYKLELTSKKPLDRVSFRLGPLKKRTGRLPVQINGKEESFPVVKSGDSSWVWIANVRNVSKVSILCRY